MSLIVRTRSVSAIFCLPVFRHNLSSVKQHCELRENWRSV